MTDYSSTLNLYKQLQQNGAEHVEANFTPPTMTGSTVEALDEAVYGAYEGEDDSQSEGQKRLLETMKAIENGTLSEEDRERIEENVKNSKIPTSILNEMLANPLINTKIGTDDVDDFMDKVMKSNKGIQKSSQIIEKVDKMDEKKHESKRMLAPQQQSVGIGTVDYEKISEIVESVVNTRLAEFEKRLGKTVLNENKHQNPFNGIKVIQLKENGSFLMLDTDDNIYECSMKYKGKNKKRSR